MTSTKCVHRFFYPSTSSREERVHPVIKAESVVDSKGVHLEFLLPRMEASPDGLKMLARWLYSLSHEAEMLATEGLISETSGYDVSRECAIDMKA